MPRVRNLLLRNSAARRTRTISAAYTATMDDDDIILANTTAASRTITLPPLAVAYDAQTGTGKTFTLQKITAANNMVIEGNAAETINGSLNQTIGSQWTTVLLTAGATDWSMHATATIATTDIADNAVTNVKMANDSVDSLEIVAGAVDLAHMSANSIDSAQYVDGSIDPEHFAAGAVDITALGTGAVSPVKILSTAVAPAADAACAILNTTTEINLTVTAAGTVVISTTSSVAGQTIYIRAAAVAGGGSYTLAVTGGTLTFNSTGEAAIVRRNTANSAWLVYSLCASSSTGANIATIV